MTENTAGTGPLIIDTNDDQKANPDQYFLQRKLTRKEFTPIDAETAFLKEKLLLQHYFGNPDCSASDFIDGNLDAVLSVQLLSDDITVADGQKLVKQYICNYVNWALIARLHSVKTQNMASFSIQYNKKVTRFL